MSMKNYAGIMVQVSQIYTGHIAGHVAIASLKKRVTVYCIICGQRIYQQAFPD